MRANPFKAIQHTVCAALGALLLASGAASAADVALTAAPSVAVLPDGQSIPMWGYSCGAVVAPATCAALNPNAGTGWSPVVITIPSGQPLTITLTNSLSFATASGTNAIPTSLVIVGQLGGGLGAAPTRTPSPVHLPQGPTWPIAGPAGGGNPTFTPPAQPDRVQSFGTEVAAGSSQVLSWNALRPGTYLIESGTHPSIQGPMGLYGVLVVTDAAYPGAAYDADVTALMSEIDAVQNRAVDTAVRTAGFNETKVWNGHTGECGDPTSAQANTCYPPAVNYDPRYYLINGVAFDRANPSRSALAIPATATSGNVLLRLVNAGLRMHVPAVVGLPMKLYAEDGNILPGLPKAQDEVFMAAGKTYDVILNPQATAGTYTASTFPIFDRELSLSTNNQRDGGMQAYLQVAGGALPAAAAASATPDTYSLVAGNPITIADPAKGVMANDVGVYGVQVSGVAANANGTYTLAGGTLAMNANGTFTYTPNAGTTSDSFTYCGNGATSGALCTTVTLAACTGTCLGAAPTANADAYTSNIASQLQISEPGVLANDVDPSGHPLTAQLVGAASGGTVTLNADGSFTVTPATAPVAPATSTVTFQYNAVNSQNTASTAPATVTVTFNGASGLAVSLKDGPTGVTMPDDYRWIIEEDRTFQIDPATQQNNGGTTPVPSLGTNFHTSYMPVVATGCVGTISCGAGQTILGAPAPQQAPVNPSQVALDPTKHYYISILPGDAGNTFISGAGAPVGNRPFSIAQDCGTYAPGSANWAPGTGTCGHGMSGAPIAPPVAPATAFAPVNVTLEETPLPTAKISVFVFQDDQPLNGEPDEGGGVDVLAPNEPGLGEFAITLFDQAGGFGDPTGQITYDMFNMPVSNSLAGQIDPATGQNACPIAKNGDGLVGMIVTCPKYEADGTTLSPLAGQAVIANLYPGLYEVVATPGASRIARGEEWLQTNTLDGTKPQEAFIKPGEPAYFQEFGPAGYHVAIGFANPDIINKRKHNASGSGICDPAASGGGGVPCTNSVSGMVTTTRMSRTPDQRLYSSGSYDANSYTSCYVSLGDPDGEDFAFAKCKPDGTFSFTGIPDGNWRITVFDQWNDLLVDGLSFPAAVHGGQTLNMGDVPMQQWRANVYTRTFFDQNGDGVSQDTEPGLSLLPTNMRYRDGSYMGFNNTDLNGYAAFNEIFPFMNWMVLEADTTRYKQTGVHVVYDAGGPADGTPGGGTSTIASHLANTLESSTAHLPTDLRVPGAVYCDNADCTGFSIQNGPGSSTANPSTGRIDPPWITTEGWQGLLGQSEFVEFGKAPYAAGENGGIHGEVVYASTRPFDDPSLNLHLSWEPNVPHVTVNLYQKGTAADGTESLTLVDTVQTSSWDDWAQGFRSDGRPNMNCPGQETTSPFFFTLKNSPMGLNPATPLPYASQFKCYDGWAMLNQIQPAPYDGMYAFPSVTGRDPASGKPVSTNCKVCGVNPADGTPMLPPGKYVVEVIVPPGYELVKEEDKNILIGDNYIAPVVQQFGGLGSIFILPDQAAMNATYNPYNQQNPTTNLGSTTFPRNEGDTGSVESYWPCVGAKRVVPDYLSLFPGAQEVAPFAGASRNLCDRKEVTLDDQASTLAKFYIFSSTHVAAHYTGLITDDFASEFDPFSPSYGEKFAVPNVPVSEKDWAGKEISRTYSDQWGAFDGLNYSTWEVNPPNPTGYAPNMMIMCMNDPGPILDTRPTLANGAPNPTFNTMITDPLYNPNYSQFCYEWSFMPGQTAYLDTPVVPTAGFAEGYNTVDCAYPDTTPAIKSVTGDASGGGAGPWVSAPGHTLTITALGDQQVPNHAYSGPQATTVPFNEKFITRHYGFGASRGRVTIGGVNVPPGQITWSDTQITLTVPNNVPLCNASNPTYLGANANARCGELVVIAANGKQSIDSITVTVGGKAPSYVNGENATNAALQTAIDNAAPGDLVIVGPGTYHELLLMWKPVRLQGVGAASVTLDANAHPAGKLDPWRAHVACLFGLDPQGRPATSGSYPGCTIANFGTSNPFAVDRVPLEGIIGWDTTVNGNLAEFMQEPTLMGAYEGAGITVLGKGVRIPSTVTNPVDIFGSTAEAVFPAGTELLTASPADCRDFPSNFLCNPSRIDGLTITNSSQGGGGIFVHGWNHYLEIANNRIYANTGTLTGGITVGQGEFPDPNIVGDTTTYDPALTIPGFTAPNGTQAPYYLQHHVSVHNNMITRNASLGDELYSATPSAGGGATFCTGSDYYKFDYNWVCGNLSTGDGGGVVHSGFIYNGDISHNWILFNQSNNPTIPTYGGGLAVLAAAPDRSITLPDGTVIECGSTNDQDCPPGLSEGTGPGLVIDSNLIMGNTAESGSGGGIRLQGVNGQEVTRFAGSTAATGPDNWYGVSITNNMIANNVAGWDGGGVSMEDALKVSFVNNTVASNDTTASAGVLFNTLGAPLSASPTPVCDTVTLANCVTTSTNQAAGLVAIHNSSNLIASLPATITCPAGYGYTGNLTNGQCRQVSLPRVLNDLFWQNRAFHLDVHGTGPGLLNQQNLVTLVPQLDQTATGQCVTGGVNGSGNVTYWDIGVRGDTGPTNHGSGFTLRPSNSVLTSLAGGYNGSGNTASNPALVTQYCNGSRIPPENGGLGFNVDPGVADATVPNPLFSLIPTATVDEGNNWINMTYGPLSVFKPDGATRNGDYAIGTGSSAVNHGANRTATNGVPVQDICGHNRPAGAIDIGAYEITSGPLGGCPLVTP